MSEWRRILYAKQPFPDNYTPPTFLSSLRRNHDVKWYTHREAMRASSAVSKQIWCARH